jgi:AcrR family transcriptional regulator
MTAIERRESILMAAVSVFGERGYQGATTDAIAHVAGISQAYVVRMFGSKEELFVAAADWSVERVIEAFREAIAHFPPHATPKEKKLAMGSAYSGLLANYSPLLTLMHFSTLGRDPKFGPMAREHHLRIYRVVRDEALIPAPEATVFLAHGMLINVLLALRLPEIAESNRDAREHLSCAFEIDEEHVSELSRLQPRLFPEG